MSRRKPLLIGALALGAGVVAALKARRGSAPTLPPPPDPAPPPAAEPAAKPPPAQPPAESAATASKAAPSPKSSAKQKPKASPKGKGTAKPAESRTRDELYREAKRLGIEGRSKMSKGELERAIAKAGGR